MSDEYDDDPFVSDSYLRYNEVKTRARDIRCDQHGWPDPRWHHDDCECVR